MDKEAHEQIELQKEIGFRNIQIRCCATCQHANLRLTTDYMKHLDPEDTNPTVFDSDIECICTRHPLHPISNPNYVVCENWE